nr:hypothetical protein [Tanacetum cinerariifolium]
EGIPYEASPATFPRRLVAEEAYPQRHVAGETPRMSLGKAVNVVVGASPPTKLLRIPKIHRKKSDNDEMVKMLPVNGREKVKRWELGCGLVMSRDEMRIEL